MVVISSFSFSQFKRSNKIELNLTGVVRSNLIKYTFLRREEKMTQEKKKKQNSFIFY